MTRRHRNALLIAGIFTAWTILYLALSGQWRLAIIDAAISTVVIVYVYVVYPLLHS